MCFLTISSICDFALLKINFFFISICFPSEPENDPVEITLNTSDLTKCEWCNVRKLPVVFLQTIPTVYQKLSMQLQMNVEDKVWNDCKGINKLTSKFCRIDYNNMYNSFNSRIWVHFDGFLKMYIIYISYRNLVRQILLPPCYRLSKSPQNMEGLTIKPRFSQLESFKDV